MNRFCFQWQIIFYSWLLFTWAYSSNAKERSRITPIHNGITHIDLNGDTKEDVIISSYVDISNSHNSKSYTFFILEHSGKREIWQRIVWEVKDKLQMDFNTLEGADCILRDFRLIRFHRRIRPILVMAEREFGQSYADKMPVKFTYFHLFKNKDHFPGDAYWKYVPQKVIKSKKKYCDVTKSFTELLN